MTDQPPDPQTPPNSRPPQNDDTLRLVARLVMAGSLLGLLGFGVCALLLLAERDTIGLALIVLPPVAFFGASIWVCRELISRLSK